MNEPILERDPADPKKKEINPLLKFALELGPLLVFFFANARGEWLAERFPALTELGGPIFIATGLFISNMRLGKDGAFQSMQPGSVFIDNTTASAEIARELHAEAARRGFAFLDAPVSGGQAGAENGVLTVMVGGDQEAFDQARPVIGAYARMVGLMGPSGAGQLTKMVNQICIASLVQGLAEGIHFGKKAGLDIEQVVEVISKGAAGSWQMENRHKTMNAGKYDFGFAVDWMRKDLGICLSEADRNGAKLPITALVDQFYKEVQAMGGSRWDTSSLLARLER